MWEPKLILMIDVETKWFRLLACLDDRYRVASHLFVDSRSINKFTKRTLIRSPCFCSSDHPTQIKEWCLSVLSLIDFRLFLVLFLLGGVYVSQIWMFADPSPPPPPGARNNFFRYRWLKTPDKFQIKSQIDINNLPAIRKMPIYLLSIICSNYWQNLRKVVIFQI